MNKPTFKHIGIMGKCRNDSTKETLCTLIHYLKQNPLSISIEEKTALAIHEKTLSSVSAEELSKQADLVIVIGGDGSLLHAAHSVTAENTPIVGINRGRLGFLTDINPDDITTELDAILAGEYHSEKRFLLKANTQDNSTYCTALNDIVLATGGIAHMIEFEIYINDKFLCSERADGVIIATPTGSTAYALSGGGPILQPSLDAIVIVSMFPHTLTHRPIVIPGDSEITIKLSPNNKIPAKLSGDGQAYCELSKNQELTIKKHSKSLTLLHPKGYDYFACIRSKLFWGKKLT